MTFKHRQNEITSKIAIAAMRQPLLSSGLWFHHDIRDNFYYASYLFAAAVDGPEQLSFEADAAKRTAAAVLLEVLRLQDQNASSDTYGHWPLGLGENPREAKPHSLPVELMGSLMAFLQAAIERILTRCWRERLIPRFFMFTGATSIVRKIPLVITMPNIRLLS